MTNDIERTESTGGVTLPLPHTSNPLLGEDVANMSEALTDSRKSGGETTESSSVVSTAEDYWESCKKLDQLRCHIGERLSPEAAELYGPTWLCSRRIYLLFKWRNKKYGTTLDEPEESSIMLGPRWPILLLDTIGVLGAAALFTASDKEYVYWEFHLVVWVLGAITVGLMYWCALTNPGIVRPRRKDGLFTKQVVRVRIPVPMYKQLKEKKQQMSEKEDYGAKVEVEAVKKTGTNGMTTVWLYDDKEMTFKECNADLRAPSVLCDTEEGMMEMNLRFCTTCHIYRAPRTHHCSVCDCCVDEIDHHCFWLGCCVGKNNYYLFFSSLVSVHIMMICVICFNLIINFSYVLNHQYLTPQEALKLVNYLPLVLYAFIFLLGIFFSGLMVVHIYLQVKGITTAELLKRPYRRSPFYGINPWYLGSKWKNMKYRMFLRTLPSLHSEAYYPVMVSALIESRKLDMLMQLPKKERERVEKKMQSDGDEGETSEIRE
ncbi:Palmitoyltransferase [Trypanosoma melophagium]|uniref:Palmitoyltransferase n=1 Tax=Trypanosoma melophagium TaxID=715481 RepID=UPI00351A86B5|nr:Palmitoyltransferase [Trypanosoma melophagium]